MKFRLIAAVNCIISVNLSTDQSIAHFTCNDQTLGVAQSLSEEAGDDELWVHEEEDLFLHQARA